jgi:hypothetical protein
MDSNTLSPKKIEEGASLVSKLDRGGFIIASAFWLYEKSRVPSWKLYLASTSPPINVKEDPIKAHHILSEIAQLPSAFTHLSPDDIQLIPLDHPFITNISKSIQTGPGTVGMRLTGNQFDEFFVEDLYIYRMNL